MSIENIAERTRRLRKKMQLTDNLIFYKSDGRMVAEDALHLYFRVLQNKEQGKQGMIEAVDYERSAMGIGNGVLFSLACFEDGFFDLDPATGIIYTKGAKNE